jgi:acyl-coenzyme A thioesterase PaaI-like protein
MLASGAAVQHIPQGRATRGSPAPEPDLEAKERDVSSPPSHILAEVGWNVRQVGEALHGEAAVIPQLLVPGQPHLRVSMLAAWADQLLGLLAVRVMAPRVPTTLDLDVHLVRPAPGEGLVTGRARLLKAGRTVLTSSVEFADANGEVFAEGAGSFMLAGDPHVRLPSTISLDRPSQPPRIVLPIAERAGCERRAPGLAVLPRREDGLNSSNTVNGGLLALAVEEAVLSLAPHTTLCSLGLRYLRPVRTGPAVAQARLRQGLATVELFDQGNDNRLAVTATARVF